MDQSLVHVSAAKVLQDAACEMAALEGRPKIIVRFRPLSDAEGCDECVSVSGGREVSLTAGGASHCFTFDDVLVRWSKVLHVTMFSAM